MMPDSVQILLIFILFIAMGTSACCNFNLKQYRKYGWILLFFGISCLITSFFINSTEINLDYDGNYLGPLSVTNANSQYSIEINEPFEHYGFSDYVNVEVLDENKEYLFSFGKELYKEEGRDNEGRWTETVNHFQSKITLKNPGIYYFAVKNENKVSKTPIYFSIQKLSMSEVPHKIAGVLAMIFSLILLMMSYPKQMDKLSDYF